MDTVDKNLADEFHVCIKVIEAKGLPESNISSFVKVQVGEEEKCTKVEKNTNNPYYNEYFVFELQTTFEKFMGTIIFISIVQPRKKLRFKKLIGCIKFDVGIIWSQPNQQLQQWLPITLPSDHSAKVRGLLSCYIKVELPEYYKRPTITEEPKRDSIVGKRVRYKVKIYKCIGLKFQPNEKENAPNVLVRVLFAGKTGKTTKRVLRECVEWNEVVTFIATFPPLFHKLTCELVIVNDYTVTKDFHLSEQIKFLKENDQHIFGPNYVHLYKNESVYKGSLFMAIEIDGSVLFRESDQLHAFLTLPIEKYKFGHLENFLCCGILFSAMLNGRSWVGKNIQLDLNFGYTGESGKDETKNHPKTDSFKVVPGNSDFCFLPITEKKPCVFICSEWPDYTHRLKNYNMLSNITHKLKEDINKVEDLIANGNTLEAKSIIKSSLLVFKRDCQEVCNMLVPGVSDLDRGRVHFLSNFLNFEIPKMVSSCIEESRLGNSLRKSVSLLSFVVEISKEIQDSLPYVLLSLKNDQSTIGTVKLNPRRFLFAKNPIKRGYDCGKITSIFVKSTNKKLTGRLDIWLWLGHWDDVSQCIKAIPPGTEDLSKMVALPYHITYNNAEKYVIYCRIYSGYITDVTCLGGPCDPFVRVMLLNQSQQTKAEKKSLAPTWKETLTLSDIMLYPSHPFNLNNPPLLTVEYWNKATNPPSLIGVELAKPSYIDETMGKNEFNFQWLNIGNKGRILCSLQIIHVVSNDEDPFHLNSIRNTLDSTVLDIPTVSFRLEVVFWGVRPIDTYGLKKNITRVQTIIQCSTSELKSNFTTRSSNTVNFTRDSNILPLELPRVNYFSPPLILQIMSDNEYVGCVVERNVYRFQYKLPTKKEWDDIFIQHRSLIDMAKSRHDSISMPDLIPLIEMESRSHSFEGGHADNCVMYYLKYIFYRIEPFLLRFKRRVKRTNVVRPFLEEEEESDWWYGYYSGHVKIYNDELENQQEFNGLNDVLETFTIKERKEETFVDTMKVKAIMCLYQWPSENQIVTYEGQDPEKGVLGLTKHRDHVKLLVRVYCIRAHSLDPKDPNGLSDPYIEIATASNRVSDKRNYIPKQLDPMFGRCLEIPATLPTDSMLAVRVMDWDRFSPSDLIGETVIDIENRFYSKHRATCGLPIKYSLAGHLTWRDTENPTEILEKLCNTYNLPLPQYFEKSVLIGSKEFIMVKRIEDKNKKDRNEELALQALNSWNEMPVVGRALVPHHVETRSLYKRGRPGMERGKLELWVDLFDESSGEIPAPIDIRTRVPEHYELRVVIVSTARIPLIDDSFFVGKKHVDIFVKGWLWDPAESQRTDVHYISLNGAGNFNWRFVFKFLYQRQEKRMVIHKKARFSVTSEMKVPPLLHLQVWDEDRLSANDFIGAMVLDLSKMPRGGLTVQSCKARHRMMSSANTVDLFRVKRMRGWWPFFQMSEDMEPMDVGYLEAEFHLLTKEEALMNPAGLGRDPPNPLPPPFRPSIRINFWLAPIRAIWYLICLVNKTTIFLCVFSCASVVFILIAIYSFPVFVTKRIIGA